MVQHSRKRKPSNNAHHQQSSEFLVVNASMSVSIPPVFARNPRAGVDEMLDGMLMRYIPSLGGVALAHSDISFVTKSAAIVADCPFLVCEVVFDTTIWCPRIGMRLVGKISLCSPDHISLLVHRTFNVSIPHHHIPTDNWAFEYGPAENDPEFGSGTETKLGQHNNGDTGKWLHRLTAEPLGGQGGYIEFTVVGFTVANEMLSLLGSIQPNPFSSLHTPRHQPPQSPSSLADQDQQSISPAVESDLDADHSSEEDTFAFLGRKADEAAKEDTRIRKKARLEKEASAKEIQGIQRTKARKKRERKPS